MEDVFAVCDFGHEFVVDFASLLGKVSWVDTLIHNGRERERIHCTMLVDIGNM